MTEIIDIDPASPQPDRVARAAACLRRGGLVAIPTETVYGLGVHALDRNAVLRLFAAKQRPANDPLIVHVSSLEAVHALVSQMPAEAAELARRFWPGPLTLVMRRSAIVPDEVTAGLPTVAVRVPAHPVARAILEQAAIPVAAPSANLFSRPSPTSAAHVLDDLNGRIDMVVNAGSTEVGVESTVLDISGDTPILLRPGAVTIEMVRAILRRVQLRGDVPSADSQPLPSPGLLSRHYAPSTPLTLFRGAAASRCLAEEAERIARSGQRVAVIGFDEDANVTPGSPMAFVTLGPRQDMKAVTRRLYAALREADAQGADVILMRDVEGEDGLAAAVRDRLKRAAVRFVDT